MLIFCQKLDPQQSVSEDHWG